MMRVRALMGRRVLVPKKTKKAKDGTVELRVSKLGRVHGVVFSPDGLHVVGLAVKRPDIAFMFERGDAFLALDSFKIPDEKSILITRPEDGVGTAAIKRLGIDWNRCIMWTGMDAKTTDGTVLGYISDAEFDGRCGRVLAFFCTESGASTVLLGDVRLDADLVRGYRDGCMIVDVTSDELQHEGGLAALAGENYARMKQKGAAASREAAQVGKQVGKQVGEATGKAVDKGSYALGKAIGKAKKQVKKSTGSKKGMFAAFKEEFDKASK